jgi:hypothetical protein
MPRYIALCQCLGLVLTFSFYRQGTIMRLSDDVLLEIFRYYLGPSPRFRPTLVHVCCKWRHIVFASPQALHLRLFCTPSTPVLKTLDSWPMAALPIVMEYGGSQALGSPAPEDDFNIITALKQSHRVSSISLTVTISLLEKLCTIRRPFVELEDLILLSRESIPLTLPRTFLWGPRLCRLHLTRIVGLPLLHSFVFFILLVILWTFSFTKLSIISQQRYSRLHCLGWLSFDHFHSISPLPPSTFPRSHRPCSHPP